MFEEHASGLCQLDAAAGAIKQSRSQLVLQRCNLLAQGGLRDVQAGRGLEKTSRLADADEVPKLPQFHVAGLGIR